MKKHAKSQPKRRRPRVYRQRIKTPHFPSKEMRFPLEDLRRATGLRPKHWVMTRRGNYKGRRGRESETLEAPARGAVPSSARRVGFQRTNNIFREFSIYRYRSPGKCKGITVSAASHPCRTYDRLRSAGA